MRPAPALAPSPRRYLDGLVALAPRGERPGRRLSAMSVQRPARRMCRAGGGAGVTRTGPARRRSPRRGNGLAVAVRVTDLARPGAVGAPVPRGAAVYGVLVRAPPRGAHGRWCTTYL
ncbi:hypothetical protein AMK26_32325 [Streptomyces sp. CB03234]|nr:hypothetical protein AMK26_32325 [Streptomyces sp. CB03234]